METVKPKPGMPAKLGDDTPLWLAVPKLIGQALWSLLTGRKIPKN